MRDSPSSIRLATGCARPDAGISTPTASATATPHARPFIDSTSAPPLDEPRPSPRCRDTPRHPCYPLGVSTSSRERRGAGGTPGGVGEFFVGLVMTAAGGYLLLNQVQVTTSFWRFGQYGGFGLTLLPLLVGVAFLFYDGKSVIGWILTIAGAAAILASILMNMDIYFRQTSLFNTLVMLVLLFGGLGLIARSLRSGGS